MTTFILVISFLLHMITLAVIYYLFKQVHVLKKDNASDIMDLFEVYLQDIKDENKRLQEVIGPRSAHSNSETFSEIMPSVKPGDQPIKEMESSEENDIPPIKNIDDYYESSLEAKVLQLHNQGLSEEKIARELSCGKTEVALIISLYAKKES